MHQEKAFFEQKRDWCLQMLESSVYMQYQNNIAEQPQNLILTFRTYKERVIKSHKEESK
jgi:hypothetical protein